MSWGLILALTAPVWGRQNNAQPPVAEPAATIPGIPALEQELKNIAASTEWDDTLKARLTELYKQAIDDLKLAEQWAAKAATFESATQEAPARLKALREELARPAADPVIEIPTASTLADLELILALEQAALKAAREEKDAVERDRQERADRITKIPDELQKVRQELEAAKAALNLPPPADEAPPMLQARLVRQQARIKALEAQANALEREGPSYTARGELLSARGDVAARRIAYAEASVKAWQKIVQDAREEEAENAARAARQAKMDAARQHPLLLSIAEQNTQYAEERKQLVKKIETTTARLNQVQSDLTRYTEELDSIRRKIETVGLTRDFGEYLRRQRASLPSVAAYRQALRQGEAENSSAILRTYELDDARSLLAVLDARVQSVLAQVDAELSEEQRETLRSAVRELLQNQATLLDDLRKDYDEKYARDVLLKLNQAQRLLIARIEEYAAFIDERVLWVRSTNWPSLKDIQATWQALRRLAEPSDWVDLLRRLVRTARQSPHTMLTSSLGALIVLIFVLFRQMTLRRLRLAGEEAVKRSQTSFAPTLRAFLLTVALVIPWPLLLWSAGSLVEGLYDVNPFAAPVGKGLKLAAVNLAILTLIRQLSRPGGLGESHFDWNPRALRVIRRELLWFTALWIPLLMLNVVANAMGDGDWQPTLGRLCFILRQLLFSALMMRLFRRQGGVLQEALASRETTWAVRLHWAWFPSIVLLPLVMAGLSLAGYHYTASHLAPRLHLTVPIAVGVTLLGAMALRWLLLSHRRIAMLQARQRRAALAEGATTEAATPEQNMPRYTLASLSAQTRSMLRIALSVVFILSMWGVWVDVLPALRIFDQVELWTTQVPDVRSLSAPDGAARVESGMRIVPITLHDVLVSAAILLLALLAYRNLPGLMEFVVLQRLAAQPGVRFAITAVTRYLIVAIGVITSFQNIGVTWDKYQWLVAALSVGIGFGLQEIVANFVSGIIILIERPIRIGDIVTVGNVEGKVTRIRIRATTITDWDRRDLVVPNREFITTRVINWTLTDPVTRVTIPVGVAYGTDVDQARRILESVARNCPYVLPDPPPSAVFHGFGDSALNLTLRVFLGNRDFWTDLMNELHTNIDREFRRAGIEIAFPQRDIHIRSVAGLSTNECPTVPTGAGPSTGDTQAGGRPASILFPRGNDAREPKA